MQAKIESALKGEYSLHYLSLFKEAWAGVSELKGPFWIGLFLQLLCLGLILIITNIGLAELGNMPVSAHHYVLFIVSQLISGVIGFLFLIGIYNLCLLKLLGQSIKARMVLAFLNWRGIKKLFFLAVIYCVVMLLLNQMLHIFLLSVLILAHPKFAISFLIIFCIIAVITLALFLVLWFVLGACLNAALLITKLEFKLIQALSVALRALLKHGLKVVGLYLLCVTILILALIPLSLGLMFFIHMAQGHYITGAFHSTQILLGILTILSLGIIWILPWLANVNVLLFKTVFGIEARA